MTLDSLYREFHRIWRERETARREPAWLRDGWSQPRDIELDRLAYELDRLDRRIQKAEQEASCPK